MMFRFWATNEIKYFVQNPIFNLHFKKRQLAQSRLYTAHSEQDSENKLDSIDDDQDGFGETEVTGMLNMR